MIELRISAGGRRFLAWKSDHAVQDRLFQVASDGDVEIGVGREGRKTIQQLQTEKLSLYAQLGHGDDPRVLDAISERISAQIALLSEKIAAEASTPLQVSKALVPVASAQV